ncbi:MAG: glycosyltransferase [Candidatus Pacebacteria bacterium]|nr:glycosyltransferase [Candidatus Paceibacterota bacterium]
MLIGTDRAIFASDSAVRERIARLGSSYTDGLDSIVLSARKHGISEPQELAPKVHAYPTNSRSRLLYGWDALRVAKRVSRPDIVSAQDPFETGLAALFISRFWKVPLAVEIHTDFLAPSFTKHSLLNRLRVLIAGYVLRRAAGGYAVSDDLRDRIVARYHLVKPFQVLPIYTDVSRFAPVAHTKHSRFETALLWVGRMEEEKNPERALEALVAALRAGFNVGLTFVGDGSLRTALEARAQREHVSEWVEFVGRVTDVAPYYATADLLLVTSEYEGYGMVIVEALAAGVPVLSTNVGIAKEAGGPKPPRALCRGQHKFL